MPEGSSSAAPVIRPGPSDLAQRPSHENPGSRRCMVAGSVPSPVFLLTRPPSLAPDMAGDLMPAQSFLLPWHALAFLARLGEADRDRLLAALHLAPLPPRPLRAVPRL